MTRSPFRQFVRPFTTALALALALGGAPGHAQQTDGPDALRETFGDWSVQCRQPAEGPRRCEMIQRADHKESGQNILIFSVRYDTKGQLDGVMILPFGLRLADGVQLTAGKAVIGRYSFETCLARGCLVVAPLDAEAIATMRASGDGELRAVTREGGSFAIPVSFKGFSAAFDRLREFRKD